jgi:phage baseplate assembly protein W
MSVPRYRAWRFAHPHFDVEEPRTGLQIGPNGGIGMVDEQGSLRQSILLLLSTRPGERVMRPDYGCDLHRLIFSPNDDTTAGLAMHYVTRALERWEPRVDIVHLDAAADDDYPERLILVLEYRVRASQRRDTLSISIDLSGETA